VLDALDRKKLTIGQDIAFVSFDLPLYWGHKHLTAVVQQPEEMGKKAANLLYDWIENKHKPSESIYFTETKWRVGTSCGPNCPDREDILVEDKILLQARGPDQAGVFEPIRH
jgi:DNA-binding LacI/PurR family transcriptional regulator